MATVLDIRPIYYWFMTQTSTLIFSKKSYRGSRQQNHSFHLMHFSLATSTLFTRFSFILVLPLAFKKNQTSHSRGILSNKPTSIHTSGIKNFSSHVFIGYSTHNALHKSQWFLNAFAWCHETFGTKFIAKRLFLQAYFNYYGPICITGLYHKTSGSNVSLLHNKWKQCLWTLSLGYCDNHDKVNKLIQHPYRSNWIGSLHARSSWQLVCKFQ